MKNYSVELTRDDWQKLRAYLINNGIEYEPAECYNLVHITIWCNDLQAEKINRFLEG